MKKFGKILSSVLATSMVISCCAMNAFAASKAHTVTLSADKTTGLKAGDSVVVEVRIDNTLNLVACEYALTYDSTAFEVDTAKEQKIGMKKYENCIDIDWYGTITDDEVSPWAAFISTPTYNVADPGTIAFSWAGSDGITDAEYAVDNDLIGKFTIDVKSDAKDGEYTFALTGITGDAGENSTAAMTCAPVTVKIGEDAPAKETTSLYYTATAENVTSANKGVKFTVKTSDPDANAESTDVDVEFKDLTVEAGNVVVGLTINNIYTTSVSYVSVATSLLD